MPNWKNVDAGPRQIKDLQKAMGALRSEGQTHDELTGVIGGEENRWTYQSPMGMVRPEVTALDEEIRAKYGHQVTRATVRAIIADYEAALPEARESRPTDDKRRTPEEDAEAKAAQAARDAEIRTKQDAEQALLAQVMAKAPAIAKALIYAEYREDASDPMTDYFASHGTRTVAIGFRCSSREDFRALRAAAARFPETAHMADEDTLKAWQEEHHGHASGELEHRENYSMGMGNYLSDHGWGKSGTGWIVKSRDFPCRWISLTEDAVPEQATTPASSTSGPVAVSPSSIGREGVVEIRFAEKPDSGVIAGLKTHGFRWARGNRCWYGRDVAYAEALQNAEA